jgi:hypothetical protein
MTPEGIQSALNATRSVHQVTVDRVVYDCSLSYSLYTLVQQDKFFASQATLPISTNPSHPVKLNQSLGGGGGNSPVPSVQSSGSLSPPPLLTTANLALPQFHSTGSQNETMNQQQQRSPFETMLPSRKTSFAFPTEMQSPLSSSIPTTGGFSSVPTSRSSSFYSIEGFRSKRSSMRSSLRSSLSSVYGASERDSSYTDYSMESCDDIVLNNSNSNNVNSYYNSGTTNYPMNLSSFALDYNGSNNNNNSLVQGQPTQQRQLFLPRQSEQMHNNSSISSSMYPFQTVFEGCQRSIIADNNNIFNGNNNNENFSASEKFLFN